MNKPKTNTVNYDLVDKYTEIENNIAEAQQIILDYSPSKGEDCYDKLPDEEKEMYDSLSRAYEKANGLKHNHFMENSPEYFERYNKLRAAA